MSKFIYLTSVAVLAMVGPAWSQTVPPSDAPAMPPAAPATSGVQDQGDVAAATAGDVTDDMANSADIIVTARRRAESLQRVPVSIQAFGEEQLQARGIRTEADLQLATPGLTARATVNDNMLNFSIRGQATESFSGISPAVLAYVNEVQISGNTSTSFFDLQGVQVLKGPQGTLFGRNTTGGAILYQTQKPTNMFEGYMFAKAGNYGTYGVQGAINLPLVDDAILLRVAGDYDKADGYVFNRYFNNYTGARDARALRVSLTIKPTDGLSNEFVWAHGRYGGTNAANVLWAVNPCGSTNNGFTLVSANDCRFRPGNPTFDTFVAANPGLFPGGLTAALNVSRSLGKFESFSGIRDPFHRAASDVFTNTLAYDVSPGLTIKNITGYAKTSSAELFDNDASPYIIFSSEPNGQRRRGTQFSNEFQLSGTVADDRLTYIAGLFYSKQKNFTDLPVLVPGPTLAPVLVPFAFRDSDQSKAVFGQVSYKLADKLTVTAGGRYTREVLKKTDEPGTLWFTLFGGPNAQRVTFSKPSWTFGLDYQATSDLMIYAATRGSWRTGGLNPFTPPITAPPAQGGNLFAPETTHDIELGAKFSGRLADMPTRLNVAVYNQWVKQVQRSVYFDLNGPTSLTANIPEAQVTGVEVDGSITPSRWLELGGQLTYSNARFTRNSVTFFGLTVPFGPYPDTPKVAGAAYAQVSVPLQGDLGSLQFRGDVYAQSAFYFSSLNDTIAPNTKLPGYALVNLRATWKDPFGKPLVLSAFAKNLGNKGYYVGGLAQSPLDGYNTAAWGRPRTYGLEARINF